MKSEQKWMVHAWQHNDDLINGPKLVHKRFNKTYEQAIKLKAKWQKEGLDVHISPTLK